MSFWVLVVFLIRADGAVAAMAAPVQTQEECRAAEARVAKEAAASGVHAETTCVESTAFSVKSPTI